MKISDLMTADPVTCAPDTNLAAAGAMMREHAIRRVPVEGFGQTVLGIVSMNDVALAVGAKKAVRGSAVVDTLRSICAHHHPQPRIAAA